MIDAHYYSTTVLYQSALPLSFNNWIMFVKFALHTRHSHNYMIVLVGSPLWPVYQNIAITPPTHVWIVSMNFVQRLFELEKDASDRNLSPEYAIICARYKQGNFVFLTLHGGGGLTASDDWYYLLFVHSGLPFGNNHCCLFKEVTMSDEWYVIIVLWS